MPDSKPKHIRAMFFKTESGNEPVREWLKSLSKADRQCIGEDIATVEYGFPIGMPVCRPMGDGLYEVRTSLDDRIARVLFTVAGDRMFLLHGFINKDSKNS